MLLTVTAILHLIKKFQNKYVFFLDNFTFVLENGEAKRKNQRGRGLAIPNRGLFKVLCFVHDVFNDVLSR